LTHIAYVIWRFRSPKDFTHMGGAENQLLKLVNHIKDDPKNHVTIIAKQTDNDPENEEISCNVKIKRIKVTNTPIVSMFIFMISLLLTMMKIHRKKRIDIVHAPLPDSYIAVLYVLRFLLKIPIITRVAGDELVPFKTHGFWHVNKLLTRSIMLKLDGIQTLNPLMYEMALKLKYPKSKLYLISNGTIIPKKKRDYKKITHNIMYLGAMRFHPEKQKVEQKNLLFLINAFNILSKKNPKLTLTLVGDGNFRKTLEKRVRELNLQKKITFNGYQKDIQKYLLKTDIFVNPSWFEGMPNTVVEALSYGVFALCSNIPEHQHLIGENQYGQLFDHTNENDFVNKVLGFYAKQEYSIKIANKGRKFAEDNLSIEKTKQTIFRMYLTAQKQHSVKSLRTKILNFLFYLRSGKRIVPELNKLKQYENKTLSENFEIQKENLSKMLIYSWENVPYYREILEKAKVVIDGKVDLNYFDKIEILTKESLLMNFDSLITNDKRKRRMYLNMTGGSSGTPTKFIQDKHYWVDTTAVKWLYFSYISEYPCKLISLWGSERDINHGKINFKQMISNFLHHKKIMNSFRMTQENMHKYVEKINRFQPRIIEAYVQAIYSLAIFIKNNNLKVHSPKGIMTSAGTLYPEMGSLIEEVFKCPVLNRYGSREVGDVACSCEKNQGLHVNITNNYMEILDEKMNPVKPGELGKIYLTTLNNYSMPLIRYEIDDLAIPSNKLQCECGRGLPLIEFVEGREMTAFRTKNGSIISAVFFVHYLGIVHNKGLIKKFQVIQNDFNKITIKYVLVEGKELGSYKEEIVKSIRKAMGDDCVVNWQKVEDIEPLPSGKYLYTYSEVI